MERDVGVRFHHCKVMRNWTVHKIVQKAHVITIGDNGNAGESVKLFDRNVNRLKSNDYDDDTDLSHPIC